MSNFTFDLGRNFSLVENIILEKEVVKAKNIVDAKVSGVVLFPKPSEEYLKVLKGIQGVSVAPIKKCGEVLKEIHVLVIEISDESFAKCGEHDFYAMELVEVVKLNAEVEYSNAILLNNTPSMLDGHPVDNIQSIFVQV